MPKKTIKENKPKEPKLDLNASSAVKEFAVVRIRGSIGIRKPIKDTLQMLNLKRANHCVIIPKTKEKIGMLNKCKDYITWGEVDNETKALLVEKRLNSSNPKIFRLNPPRGGFERKGVKNTFNVGGALGYRKVNINILIKKML